MSKGFRRTPISMANSGQRSRISSRKGRRRRNAMTQAESTWKMGGEVPITRSTCPTLRPVNKDEQTKVRKEKTRHMKLRCNACLLYTSDAADEEDSVDLGGRRIIK